MAMETRADMTRMNAAAYEAPTLRVLGTVQELTEWCFWGKTLGDPDYALHIPVPITDCSS
jgi:hypothetical protein